MASQRMNFVREEVTFAAAIDGGEEGELESRRNKVEDVS